MKKGLTGLLLVTLLAGFATPVHAAQTTELHANVGSSYVLTIPKETNIDVNALSTPLNGTVKVTGNITATQNVVVSSTTNPLHNDVDNVDLPYTLKMGNNTLTSMSFSQSDLTNAKEVQLNVAISQEDWNQAKAGEYNGSIVFNATLQ